ncbi:hypothetical protein BJX63DRAFT_396913 [Aspergillus granulosus]|uniref:Uncharacterized protein n=1 Tax=Aspergillus granulosus TaxID=176169 RepID=A0ABR4HCA4_9EURO
MIAVGRFQYGFHGAAMGILAAQTAEAKADARPRCSRYPPLCCNAENRVRRCQIGGVHRRLFPCNLHYPQGKLLNSEKPCFSKRLFSCTTGSMKPAARMRGPGG